MDILVNGNFANAMVYVRPNVIHLTLKRNEDNRRILIACGNVVVAKVIMAFLNV